MQNSFSDPRTAAHLLEAIRSTASGMEHATIMEVCGTHTHEIGRLGLRPLLPRQVRLISGPGCPVCVTPGPVIDAAARLALRAGTTVCTFGDMVRVPGNTTSLAAARAAGGSVEVVSSPLEAMHLAQANPRQEFVFIAVGFETTIPATVAAVLRADALGLTNLSFLVAHRLVPPALRVLCDDRSLGIDGFMLPGHVSAILGEAAYGVILEYKVPGVITGFEPLDILGGVLELLGLIRDKKAAVENAYRRVVPAVGNPAARAGIDRIFEPVDAVYRGIGTIPAGGLALRPAYARFDARGKFGFIIDDSAMPDGCSCGDVLKGKITPAQCPLFGSGCTPESPQGPCMVSSEGTCAAYFKYEMR